MKDYITDYISKEREVPDRTASIAEKTPRIISELIEKVFEPERKKRLKDDNKYDEAVQKLGDILDNILENQKPKIKYDLDTNSIREDTSKPIKQLVDIIKNKPVVLGARSETPIGGVTRDQKAVIPYDVLNKILKPIADLVDSFNGENGKPKSPAESPIDKTFKVLEDFVKRELAVSPLERDFNDNQSDRALSKLGDIIESQVNEPSVAFRSLADKTPKILADFIRKVFDSDREKRLKDRDLYDDALEKLADIIDEVVEDQIQKDRSSIFSRKDKKEKTIRPLKQLVDIIRNKPSSVGGRSESSLGVDSSKFRRASSLKNDLNRLLSPIANLVDKFLRENGRPVSAFDTPLDKTFKIFDDFVNRELGTNPLDRLFNDDQSDRALSKLGEVVENLVKEGSNVYRSLAEKTPDILSNLMSKVIDNEREKRLRDLNKYDDALDKLADILDNIVDNRRSPSLTDIVDSQSRKYDASKPIKQLVDIIRNKPSSFGGRSETPIGELTKDQKPVIPYHELSRILKPLADVYDRSVSENGKFPNPSETPVDKAYKVLEDFINRELGNNLDRNLSDEQSDRALSKFGDIVETQINEPSSVFRSLAEKTPKILSDFIRKVFDSDREKRLKDKSLYDDALEKLADIIEDVLEDQKQKNYSSIYSNPSEKEEKLKPFKQLVDIIRNKPSPLGKSDSDRFKRSITPKKDVNRILKPVADLVNRMLNESGRPVSPIETPSDKLAKVMESFVNRELEKNPFDRELNDEQVGKALKKLGDVIESEINEESPLGKKFIPSVIKDFTDKVFDKDRKRKLKEKNLFDDALQTLGDIIQHVLDNQNPNDYSSFYQQPLNKKETVRIFSDLVDSLKNRLSPHERSLENVISRKFSRPSITDSVLSPLADLIDKFLSQNGQPQGQAESPAEKVLKLLNDFVNRTLNESPRNRYLTDDQSDRCLKKLGDIIENLVESDSRSASGARSSRSSGILQSFVDTVIDRDRKKRLKDKNKLDDALQTVADVIDHALESGKKDDLSSYFQQPSPKKDETEVIFKDLVDTIRRTSSSLEGSNLDNLLSRQFSRPTITDKVLTPLADLYDKIMNENNRQTSPDETPSKKLFNVLTDYVSRNLSPSSSQKYFNEDQSDRLLRKLGDIVEDLVDPERSSSSTSGSQVRKSPNVVQEFLNKVFDKDRKRRLKDRNKYDDAVKVLADILDLALDNQKKSQVNNFYLVQPLNRDKTVKLVKDLVETVRRSPSPTDVNLESLISKQFSRPTITEKTLASFADLYDRILNQSGKLQSTTDSPSDKLVKVINDFVDRVTGQNPHDRLLTDDQSDKLLRKLGDIIENIIDQESRRASPRLQKSPVLEFIDKTLDRDRKKRLKDKNKYDDAVQSLADIIKHVLDSQSSSPASSYYQQQPLNKEKTIKLFKDLVDIARNKPNLLDSSLESIISKQFSRPTITDRVLTPIAELFDAFIAQNQKPGSPTDSPSDKLFKVLNDFIDRASGVHPRDRLLTDEQSDRLLKKLGDIVESLVDQDSRRPDSRKSSNVLTDIVDAIFDKDRKKRIKDKNQYDDALNTLADIIEHVLDNQIPKDSSDFYQQPFNNKPQVTKILSDLADIARNKPYLLDGSFKSLLLEKPRKQAIDGKILTPLSDLFDKYISDNNKATNVSDSSGDKLFKVLDDFVDRKLGKKDRLFNDTQSDRLLSKLGEIIENVLNDESQLGSRSPKPPNLLSHFVDNVFEKDRRKRLKDKNKYDDALNSLADLIEHVLDTQRPYEASIYNLPGLNKNKTIKPFTEFVDIARNRPYLFDGSFRTTPTERPRKQIVNERILTPISDLFDKFLAENNKNIVQTDTPSDKTFKVLDDFVDRIHEKNPRYRLFNDDQSKKLIRKLGDIVEDLVGQDGRKSSASSISQKSQNPLVNFLDLVFNKDRKKRLKLKNKYDDALSALADIIEQAIDHQNHMDNYQASSRKAITNKLFNEFINVARNRPYLLDGSFKSSVFNKFSKKLVNDKILSPLSDLYDIYSKENDRNVSPLEKALARLYNILQDFVDRLSGKNARYRLFNDDQQDRLLNKLGDIIESLFDKSDSIHSRRPPNILGDFVDTVFDSGRKKRLKEKKKYDEALLTLADIVDHVLKKANENESDYYQAPISRSVAIKPFSQFVDIARNRPYLFDGSFRTTPIDKTRRQPIDDRLIQPVADLFDKLPKEDDKKVFIHDSPSEKVLKLLNDFIDREFGKHPKERLFSDENLEKLLRRLGDVVERYALDNYNSYIPIRGKKIDKNEALSVLDDFVDKVLNNKDKKGSPGIAKDIFDKLKYISDREALDIIEELIRRIRQAVNNWRKIARPKEDFKKLLDQHLHSKDKDKIIIKTTRSLPPKVYTDGHLKQANTLIKRKITYSYLDNYNPTTRVYEILDTAPVGDDTIKQAFDIFGGRSNLGYFLKPFDPYIAHSFGKPSAEQINGFLSVVNTGVKNTDLIQIHPLLTNKTNVNIKKDEKLNRPNFIEPVILDTTDYKTYVEEISKHFGGLQVTDFPLYLQGLELKPPQKGKKDDKNDPKSKHNLDDNKVVSDGKTTKQIISKNPENVQFVRITDFPQQIAVSS